MFSAAFINLGLKHFIFEQSFPRIFVKLLKNFGYISLEDNFWTNVVIGRNSSFLLV